jgi:pilus assembly protein CpaF
MFVPATANFGDRSRHAGEGDQEQFLRIKKEVHKRLIVGMDVASIRGMNDFELRRQLRQGIEELCNYGADLMSQADRERLVNEVIDETLGLGPIDPLLRDPTISDILINGPRMVYVERRGRLEPTNVVFHDEQHLLEIVQRIANRVGRHLDESTPMVDARLEDGSRVNAVIRPLAIDGALVSIRRFSARPLLAGDLIARGTIAAEMAEFLTACVQARMNIIISGSTGSGKTTFLNMLSGYIPENERIVTIEDAAELQLQQPHVARMETRPANLEGKGEVDARDLMRNALRMRPDRIIVGECRGSEAFDMLQAMTTGHDGSLSTIHANDTRDAISRLEMLVGMASSQLPLWFIHRQIASAIDLVVHCNRLSGGARKVTRISEVTGVERDVISMHDVFLFEQTGVDEHRNAQGRFVASGIRPRCLEQLQTAGVPLSPEIFDRRTLTAERVDSIAHPGQRS